jgi:hypothetical protein
MEQDNRNPQVIAYLKEVVEVGKKYGFSLSHEDGHGAFKVELSDAYNIGWLMQARDATGEEEISAPWPWNPLEG